MNIAGKRKEWIFLIVCLGLGWLAEISFFHGRIGVSYPLFIVVFYLCFFLRYRLMFQNRRIGVLLMIVIWTLAAGYAAYNGTMFYVLNLLIIPLLVFFHLVLITSPKYLKWASLLFVSYLSSKWCDGVKYSIRFSKTIFKKLSRNMDAKALQGIKRVLVGLVIGVPLLMVITSLLMSADAVFKELVLYIPNFIMEVQFLEGFIRMLLSIGIGFMFFGLLQVLPRKKAITAPANLMEKRITWDSVTILTILIMLNAVYLVFVFVQFQYFFGKELLDGYTYAEYARRGFFELLFVTVINWSIILSSLKLVKDSNRRLKLTLKIMYSVLIVVSGIMLGSAYQRLSMYETAYGYTLDRIIAQAFMVFLMIIFAYTFIRVWLEHLSLLHFYLITGLMFYTALNVMNIERIVVENNLDRYEETGKIDVYYLNSLSSAGVMGLIELYEMNRDYPELKGILENRKEELENQKNQTWQSFNFANEKAKDALRELELK
ncbi:DUF4173 domain-containing protein [Oceanobacillus piezotolerans]|uniref:DUF4173 domain-containing protein n=1 Tax=Oceanobacillus piezotolerans TaxID=2448030 RepID=A0A498D9R9_9BACI|nr:DUF4173 domain-containing protein [Oceanobacillus piezotolerans]RLL41274.1 DUF4173 domain-containing protein [Oceanobacillus piezotolerans]